MRSSDWSSDVCSSDLPGTLAPGQAQWGARLRGAFDLGDMATRFADVAANIVLPTLYVRGAMSELVSPDDAADFVERLPDGEFAEVARSEERRLGKACVSTGRSRWWTYH